MNPNDKIRREILDWFYRRNSNATSQFGKKGAAAKISDVRAGLKAEYGLKLQQVVSNLNYLMDKGWINKSDIQKTVRVKGGTVPSTVTWYSISSAGIDKIEGESEFKASARYPGINISATGTNVITLGDGNVVNAKFVELHSGLSQLREAILTSKLPDEQKFEMAVDIETAKDQLAKEEPDKTFLASVWQRIQDVATVGGFVDAMQKVAPLISPLLP
jgi:hypothetical protein